MLNCVFEMLLAAQILKLGTLLFDKLHYLDTIYTL